MHKVTVLGCNYEGAHFRGIPSDTDSTYVQITLTSEDEYNLCEWILDNFSYGMDDECTYDNLVNLIDGYEQDEIKNNDGCGTMVKIIVHGTDLEFDESDIYIDDDALPKPLVLADYEVPAGQLDVDACIELNTMVADQKVC